MKYEGPYKNYSMLDLSEISLTTGKSIILTIQLRILTWKCDIIVGPVRKTLLKTSKLSNDN